MTDHLDHFDNVDHAYQNRLLIGRLDEALWDELEFAYPNGSWWKVPFEEQCRFKHTAGVGSVLDPDALIGFHIDFLRSAVITLNMGYIWDDFFDSPAYYRSDKLCCLPHATTFVRRFLNAAHIPESTVYLEMKGDYWAKYNPYHKPTQGELGTDEVVKKSCI